MGDLAFGCFTLAKALKKGPPQIAAEIAQSFSADSAIEKVQAAGPYLNLTFSSICHGERVLETILDGSFFKKPLVESSPRTMFEYSQPNTHKELHVGHMRNLCLGDAIVKMLRYCGRDVVASTFPGDMGTHVAKCLWYMKKHNQEPVPETGKGEWLGRMCIQRLICFWKIKTELRKRLLIDKSSRPFFISWNLNQALTLSCGKKLANGRLL